jgi:ribose 5-phosphate isomerase B
MKAWKVVLGSDHAGLALKEHLKRFLVELGCRVEDVGTYTSERCDYPDYAAAAARRVAAGEFERGVLVCGTGVGVSLAANKVRGIRAAVCESEYVAEMARRHNDANLLCLGARVIGTGVAEALVRRFLETEFEGGRHAQRVDKIMALERPGKAGGTKVRRR